MGAGGYVVVGQEVSKGAEVSPLAAWGVCVECVRGRSDYAVVDDVLEVTQEISVGCGWGWRGWWCMT